MKDKITICLVNRNYPPEEGASGYFSSQLISFLDDKKEIISKIVSIGNESSYNRSTIRGLYKGKMKWLRLITSFVESYMLINKAKSLNSDVYIVLTDPAFLNYWASILFKKQKWILWTMDLYPEAFVANDLIAPKNIFYKHFSNVLNNSKPRFIISLGEKQSRFIKKDRYKNCPVIPSVVGIRDAVHPDEQSEYQINSPEWFDSDKITFAYIGNIGEAHDHLMVIQFAESLNPNDHQMIICCRGKKAKLLHAKIGELDSVTIVDEFLDKDFAYVDIQIVSLLREWTHIGVPSKALTAIQFGNPVVFFGEKQSDTWQYIQEASWHLSGHNDILSFVSKLNRDLVNQKKTISVDLGSRLLALREERFEKIYSTLRDHVIINKEI